MRQEEMPVDNTDAKCNQPAVRAHAILQALGAADIDVDTVEVLPPAATATGSAAPTQSPHASPLAQAVRTWLSHAIPRRRVHLPCSCS